MESYGGEGAEDSSSLLPMGPYGFRRSPTIPKYPHGSQRVPKPQDTQGCLMMLQDPDGCRW
eukprot:3968872-Pyramimonas_sp.AAC.1